jgi:hypothetical protein
MLLLYPGELYRLLGASSLVFNTTFSNISAISWRPVLVVEEANLMKKGQTFMGNQIYFKIAGKKKN